LNIVGKWEGTSLYTVQDNGDFAWTSMNRFHYFYNFSAGGQFYSWSDVPGRSGKYSYDNRSQNLILNYEADPYGNMPGTENLKVELLSDDELILSCFDSDNHLAYKTEYTRIN
jgi:hypothetical protein